MAHTLFTENGCSDFCNNLVERWFALITNQAIRRGSFDSVGALEKAINEYLASWNEDPKPFRWTKTADQIQWRISRAKDRSDARH